SGLRPIARASPHHRRLGKGPERSTAGHGASHRLSRRQELPQAQRKEPTRDGASRVVPASGEATRGASLNYNRRGMKDARAATHDLAVQAQGLTKRYGDVLAVDGLDLELPAGQFFGLLGPNGSGKTTTIHMLSTLVRPSSGTALVAGHDVVRDPVAVRGSIGLVFQESALDRTLSVAQN